MRTRRKLFKCLSSTDYVYNCYAANKVILIMLCLRYGFYNKKKLNSFAWTLFAFYIITKLVKDLALTTHIICCTYSIWYLKKYILFLGIQSYFSYHTFKIRSLDYFRNFHINFLPQLSYVIKSLITIDPLKNRCPCNINIVQRVLVVFLSLPTIFD